MKESTVECITLQKTVLLYALTLVLSDICHQGMSNTNTACCWEGFVFTQNIEFSPMINSPSQAAKAVAKAVAKVAARNLDSDL